MKINKIAAVALSIALLTASFASALGVDEEEIKKAGNVGTIQFENYSGPHTVIDSADTITEIGRGIGRQVASRVETSGSFNLNGKYSVIHAVDPNEKDKFDADILILNPNASVDHIKNLRRIIAGYLTAAYGYNNADATTVATFVTVYNAVYRNNLEVFQQRYKNVVSKNLTKEKCGLSTKWSEWPGKTQIVIPLNDVMGGISSVDTSVISDRNVVDNMRENNDKGIDVRKDMVDLKEREAENANEKAQESAQKAAQEKQKLDDQKNKQNQAKQDATNAKKDADAAKKDADAAKKNADNAKKNAQAAQDKAKANPDDKAAQDAAKKAQEDAIKAQENALKSQQDALAAQKAAQEAQAKADEEAKKTAEQKAAADKASQDAEKKQAFADRKETEAQGDRTEIAKDQQALLDESLDAGSTIIGLKVVNPSKELSQMVKVSTEDGSVVRLSPVNVIHRRIIYPVESPTLTDEVSGASVQTSGLYYVAICGDSSAGGNSAVKLCLLDTGSMEIQKESNEFVADDSVLVTDNTGNYYCVIKDNSNYVVAKYNKSVELLTKSPVAVEPNTPIILSSKGIVVTEKGGNIIVLDNTKMEKKFF